MTVSYRQALDHVVRCFPMLLERSHVRSTTRQNRSNLRERAMEKASTLYDFVKGVLHRRHDLTNAIFDQVEGRVSSGYKDQQTQHQPAHKPSNGLLNAVYGLSSPT